MIFGTALRHTRDMQIAAGRIYLVCIRAPGTASLGCAFLCTNSYLYESMWWCTGDSKVKRKSDKSFPSSLSPLSSSSSSSLHYLWYYTIVFLNKDATDLASPIKSWSTDYSQPVVVGISRAGCMHVSIRAKRCKIDDIRIRNREMYRFSPYFVRNFSCS